MCVLLCTSLGVYWSLRAKVPSLIWSSFTALSVASFPQPVISWTRLPSCPQSKDILLTQSHSLVMTTLSFLDSLGCSVCYFDVVLISDFTQCLFSWWIYFLMKCQFSISFPWLLFSYLQFLKTIDWHPEKKKETQLNKTLALYVTANQEYVRFDRFIHTDQRFCVYELKPMSGGRGGVQVIF